MMGVVRSRSPVFFLLGLTTVLVASCGENIGPTLPSSLTITTTSLPSAVVGASYSETLEASTADVGKTWTLVNNTTLPDGLGLSNQTGEITGVPLFSGVTSFEVQVSNRGETARAPLSIAVGIHAVCAAQTSMPVGECDTLVAFYHAMNGSGWTESSGWLSTSPPCTWYGVGCIAGSVKMLEFPQNQMSGALPVALLRDLPNLTLLYFSLNQIGGPIPAELGTLVNLEYLDLSSNRLTGPIPKQIGDLTRLEHLALATNQLVGPIPPELGGMPNLDRLYLQQNQLTGSIPSELGEIGGLQRLHLSANQLTGSIPSSLGDLSELRWLILSGNQLGSVVPLGVAQRGGSIESEGSPAVNYCYFTGNPGLSMPDEQEYRDADLDGDGKICGLVLGAGGGE